MNRPQLGDVVLLIDPQGKRTIQRLTPGQQVHTHLGYIKHEALTEHEYGSVVESQLGHRFVLLAPSTLDLLMHVRRATQIVYPKDIAYLLVKLSIFPGTRIVEAGTGSGAMTLALARHVQPTGRVYSYEEREELQLNARKNLERAGLLPFVDLKVRDIRAGFDEHDADALFLDVREPWLFLAQAHAALKPGGSFGSLVPTVNQVGEMLSVFEQMGNWVEVEVGELLHRRYKTNADRLRPEDRMIGHTGYLVCARPVSVQVEPPRTRRERKFLMRRPPPVPSDQINIEEREPLDE
jgi:tRNA (adenine57-N1/adenine58-N1)-methyltransferase